MNLFLFFIFFLQAEDGIRKLVRSRGLGNVDKRQHLSGGDVAVVLADAVGAERLQAQRVGDVARRADHRAEAQLVVPGGELDDARPVEAVDACLLYTSDAAHERSRVDLRGRRIIKKKKKCDMRDDIQTKERTIKESAE